MRKFAIAAALAVSALATAAFAAQQDFTIVNHTGQAIMTLNVSPTTEESWGPDILGVEVLPADEEAEVTFSNDTEECLWDIRVTYEDGNMGAWQGINLCEVTTVTLS
ncbi:MAG TPA: hypothetical protein VN231_13470 [Allosphingosinicella sp.]|nr:hypothetical protein [Allosphingosinicella sp.]